MLRAVSCEVVIPFLSINDDLITEVPLHSGLQVVQRCLLPELHIPGELNVDGLDSLASAITPVIFFEFD